MPPSPSSHSEMPGPPIRAHAGRDRTVCGRCVNLVHLFTMRRMKCCVACAEPHGHLEGGYSARGDRAGADAAGRVAHSVLAPLRHQRQPAAAPTLQHLSRGWPLLAAALQPGVHSPRAGGGSAPGRGPGTRNGAGRRGSWGKPRGCARIVHRVLAPQRGARRGRAAVFAGRVPHSWTDQTATWPGKPFVSFCIFFAPMCFRNFKTHSPFCSENWQAWLLVVRRSSVLVCSRRVLSSIEQHR